LIRKNYILYGKDSFQITCSGDSGSSVFSYSESLLNVSLIGIHIGRLRDYSEAIPLDIIHAIGGVVPV
ncbi:22958_t:CDS:1, partial [Racocetra persica]